MTAPAVAHDALRWGYLQLDARRYERRRYGGVVRHLNRRLLERAVARALVDVGPGSLVLHVPCGTGILGAALAAGGRRVIGADISPAMLAVARERRHARGLVRADLAAPPWRTGAFDAVVCLRFLMLVPAARRPRLLAGLAELTRGPLVVTVCHPYTLKRLTRALRRRLGWRVLGWRVKESPRLDRGALAAEAGAAGLRLERVIPVLPLFSEVWVAVMRKPVAGHPRESQ